MTSCSTYCHQKGLVLIVDFLSNSYEIARIRSSHRYHLWNIWTQHSYRRTLGKTRKSDKSQWGARTLHVLSATSLEVLLSCTCLLHYPIFSSPSIRPWQVGRYLLMSLRNHSMALSQESVLRVLKLTICSIGWSKRSCSISGLQSNFSRHHFCRSRHRRANRLLLHNVSWKGRRL